MLVSDSAATVSIAAQFPNFSVSLGFYLFTTGRVTAKYDPRVGGTALGQGGSE